MRLFSNTSQMRSKCGKDKKVAYEAIADCVTDVLTVTITVIHYWTDARQHEKNVLYNDETKYYWNKTFLFKIVQRKPAFAHFGAHENSYLT